MTAGGTSEEARGLLREAGALDSDEANGERSVDVCFRFRPEGLRVGLAEAQESIETDGGGTEAVYLRFLVRPCGLRVGLADVVAMCLRFLA